MFPQELEKYYEAKNAPAEPAPAVEVKTTPPEPTPAAAPQAAGGARHFVLTVNGQRQDVTVEEL